MKLAVMQPYFFPYIGYFQLLNVVDEFVVYDNIEFSKKGWINRNRILVNGKDIYITLPLKNDSDYLDVRDRVLADSWHKERKTMLNRISGAYRKAPRFNAVFPMLEECILFENMNLFQFIFHSLTLTKEYLGISTPLKIASEIPIDHSLRSGKKVMALCKARQAKDYVNPIGGLNLYKKEDFLSEGVNLFFLKSRDVVYEQFEDNFVPWLSIIDVMMFNSVEVITDYLNRSFEIL